MKTTPETVLKYVGIAGIAYFLVKMAVVDIKGNPAKKEAEKEKLNRDKAKKEVKETSGYTMTWTNKKGQKITTNLDTAARKLENALSGNWINEDEEQIKQVMESIPGTVVSKQKGKTWHPIQIVAERFQINTGKSLKRELTRLLNQNELKTTFSDMHLKYL